MSEAPSLDVLNERYLCPDCASPDFVLGPSGGMAMNIRCARCKSTFWFASPFSPKRIPDTGMYQGQPVNLRDEVLGPTVQIKTVAFALSKTTKRWWEFWK